MPSQIHNCSRRHLLSVCATAFASGCTARLSTSGQTQAEPSKCPPGADPDSWATYQYDSENSGYNRSRLPLESNRALRRLTETGRTACVSVVVSGERLFAVEFEGIAARNATDGSLTWRFETPGKVRAPPLVACETVFVQTGRSLHALGENDGSERWRRAIGTGVLDPTLSFVGRTLFACSSGQISAIDPSSGESVWEYQNAATLQEGIAVSSGRVFVTTGGNGSGYLYALDAQTGEHLWTNRDVGESYADPVGGREHVYVSTTDGRLCSVNARTGSTRWIREVGSNLYAPPAVTADHVYVSTPEEGLQARAVADGSLLWSNSRGSSVVPPVVSDDAVYVPGTVGSIVAVGRNEGTTRWEIPDVSGCSSLAIARDALYLVASNDLFAVVAP